MTIYDPLRRREVKLTPEEKVRQWAISWLHNELEVPMGRMMSEYSFKYNSLTYRADVMVFDQFAKPIMLVECKAANVKLDGKVIDQIIRYNLSLKIKFILITNGNSTYLCGMNSDGEYHFLNESVKYDLMIND